MITSPLSFRIRNRKCIICRQYVDPDTLIDLEFFIESLLSSEINSRSLDLAAMKLRNEWNTVDKESIEVDNYARNSGSQYRSVNNTISDYHDGKID